MDIYIKFLLFNVDDVIVTRIWLQGVHVTVFGKSNNHAYSNSNNISHTDGCLDGLSCAGPNSLGYCNIIILFSISLNIFCHVNFIVFFPSISSNWKSQSALDLELDIWIWTNCQARFIVVILLTIF